ncbi:GH3 family domain-containing protein [Amycolatopsis sp. H20-H5]|uniref:GH3 family domain-containing protein n=1 Tax=Amycolatopsis sp. H20-H5 TaxID=3046309 RepID=UPI002DBB8E5C|nr:GH3 auxin-responsive promoter family protein [Amycolatopsis sp. H20-H5]MEC3974980.1 GH3 auxin-responsive promoter family protein [Amycolatopsis sp. H20-H5]
MSPEPGSDRLDRYRARVFAERAGLLAANTNLLAHQAEVLENLLAHNADTVFGREHGFDSIRTLADFRKAVPIRDYRALEPWVERTAAGEPGVLSADDPVVYFTSSGSTGAHKKIPVTAEFMRSVFFPFFYAAWAPLAEHHPDVLARPDAVLNLKHDPLPVAGITRSGRPHLGASQVDFGAMFGEPLSAEPGSDASWSTLRFPVAPDDHLEKAYLRLRQAIVGDVRCVIGINPAAVAALPYQLSLWWQRIVREIHDGTLGGHPFAAPDPGRAAELERLAAMFGTVRPAHVWPNMRAIFCWTSGLASLYLPRLREQFGADVQLLPAPVAASEGPVGVTLDRHATAGSLVSTASVYEFVSADDELDAGSATFEPHELEPGREYHVVFSHIGGLYRYAVGDVVHVVDVDGGVPRVEYAGRAGGADVAGERLRESQVLRALRSALSTCGLEIRNASCHPERGDGAKPGYEFALAPQQHWGTAEVAKLGTVLETALCTEAPAYAAARRSGGLRPLAVRVLDREAFARDWHAEVGAGTRPAQVKDRLIRTDPANWRRLTESEPSPSGETRHA